MCDVPNPGNPRGEQTKNKRRRHVWEQLFPPASVSPPAGYFGRYIASIALPRRRVGAHHGFCSHGYNPAMPITIEIQQGGGTTGHWMLAATIGRSSRAALKLRGEYQAKVAKQQAEAADRQAEAARKTIIANIMTADDAAMPMLHIWYAGEASPSDIDLNAKNIGIRDGVYLRSRSRGS